MTLKPTARLLLALTMFVVFVFTFSYYWMGNVWHEAVGFGFLVLVILHNLAAYRWYRSLKNTPRRFKEIFNVVLTFPLIVAILILTTSSFLISEYIYRYIKIDAGSWTKQLHYASAYWSLLIISIHIGLRWSTVMAMVKRLFNFNGKSKISSYLLRAFAMLLVVQGIRSSIKLGLGQKLLLRPSLEWWDFTESVAPFFLHCVAMMSLFVTLTHYAIELIDLISKRKPKCYSDQSDR